MSKFQIAMKIIASLGFGVFFGYIPVYMFQGKFSCLSVVITAAAAISLGTIWAILWAAHAWVEKK